MSQFIMKIVDEEGKPIHSVPILTNGKLTAADMREFARALDVKADDMEAATK
jgi:hypothetical protein